MVCSLCSCRSFDLGFMFAVEKRTWRLPSNRLQVVFRWYSFTNMLS